MESIGDFALDIIPRLDTVKLYSGITALNSLSDIAGKVWNVFKGAYGVVDDTADKLRDLAFVGKELNMPVEQIKTMENLMRKFGLGAEQAARALKSMAKFRGGAPFGEFDTGLIMKAGLLPTDFGKDPFKNLELLSKKYTSTENINVRAAIEALVPGLERIIASPQLFQQYLAEARKQTKISGIDFEQVEKYGKAKGDMSIALDNLAMAMSNAALPGLTSAINTLTSFLNQPEVQSFFTGIGKVLNFTGEKVKDVAEGKPVLESSIVQGLREKILQNIVEQFKNIDFHKSGESASAHAREYLETKFNVVVHTDGTAADVKIEQADRRRNMNSIMNTNKSQKVSN